MIEFYSEGKEKISGIVSPFVPTQLQTRLDGYSQKSLGSFVSCFRNGPKRNFRKQWKLTQPFTAIEVARRQGLIGYILRLMGDIPQEHY